MSNVYDELKSLFIKEPASAIKKCQDIITSLSEFNTYQEFYSYHLQHPRVSTCQREWTDGRMSIHCFECGIDKQSCFCLQCFVNGNHKGHDYVIYPSTSGNCDCGDVTLCKPSGFCKHHQGVDENEHPENYLDEKLRKELTDVIFKAAFASFPRIQNKPESKTNLIFQFLSSFLKFGDGFRRLIAISLTERIKFDILIGQIFEYKKYFNELFKQFCGNLLNDQLFKINFARSNYKLLLSKTIPNFFSKFRTNTDDSNYNVWNDFWFHSFAPQPIKLNITRYNFDWVTFSIGFSNYMKNFFSLHLLINFKTNIPNFFNDIPDNMYNASLVQPNEETQRFFDELFTTVLNCGTNKKEVNDTVVSASFFEMHENHYYYSMYLFIVYYYPYMNCFKLKKNLKYDKLIEELDRSLDISQIYCLGHNELGEKNDLFVSNYIDKIDDISSIFINKESTLKVDIIDHFRSFHNGGAFYFSLPLFDALCYLMRLDNMSRIKIARLLLKEKFKKLRIKLAIVALKKLCALLCSHQSLVSKRNYSLITILSFFLNDYRNVHLGFPLVFPLFQLLIGLQSEDDNKLNEFSIKEFFAFEMARELGIFDDYTGKEYKDENVLENQKQMIVSFLYLSLLLNIERTLFNFNAYYFMEEQIISALKQGISSPVKLNDCCNLNACLTEKCHFYFNTIISKVAKMNSDGEHDISFTLKDGIECKPLSAIVPFNDQKVLLNKEISKNPDVLIKVQEFEDEEEYFFNTKKEVKANPEDENNEDEKFDSSGIKIKLKEFLSTPTVLAITYHTLRMSAEKIELNDHLALNILILISKFVEDFDSTPYESSTVIHYDLTINDLVSKLKKVLFNFKIDGDGNASVTNTLNKQNFKTLLSIKIGSDNLEPRSFIDILINKGEIGKSVLRQLSVDFENDESQDEKQLIKERKKQKAKKLKESIINKYKNIISNYYTNNTEESACKHENNEDDETKGIKKKNKKDTKTDKKKHQTPSDDDDDSNNEVKQPKKVKKSKDDESSDDLIKSSKKNKKKDSDKSDEWSDEVPRPKKAKTDFKTMLDSSSKDSDNTTSKKTVKTTKKVTVDFTSSADDDDEKNKPKKTSKKTSDDFTNSSDDDDKKVNSTAKKTANKSKKYSDEFTKSSDDNKKSDTGVKKVVDKTQKYNDEFTHSSDDDSKKSSQTSSKKVNSKPKKKSKNEFDSSSDDDDDFNTKKKTKIDIKKIGNDSVKKSSDDFTKSSDTGVRSSDIGVKSSDKSKKLSDDFTKSSDENIKTTSGVKKIDDKFAKSSDDFSKSSDVGRKSNDKVRKYNDQFTNSGDDDDKKHEIGIKKIVDKSGKSSDTDKKLEDRYGDEFTKTSDDEIKPKNSPKKDNDEPRKVADVKFSDDVLNSRTRPRKTSEDGKKVSFESHGNDDDNDDDDDISESKSETASNEGKKKKKWWKKDKHNKHEADENEPSDSTTESKSIDKSDKSESQDKAKKKKWWQKDKHNKHEADENEPSDSTTESKSIDKSDKSDSKEKTKKKKWWKKDKNNKHEADENEPSDSISKSEKSDSKDKTKKKWWQKDKNNKHEADENEPSDSISKSEKSDSKDKSKKKWWKRDKNKDAAAAGDDDDDETTESKTDSKSNSKSEKNDEKDKSKKKWWQFGKK